MTALGPFIAFGLLFITVSVALSVVLTLALLAGRRWLRRLGPWVERRAASAVLTLPPVVALVVVGALAAASAVAVAEGSDHCLAHAHHLHLCVAHAAAWVSNPWALALVSVVTTFVAVRGALALGAHAVAQRQADRLRALGTLEPAGCYVVPAGERFAFTAGVFAPVILVSSAAWGALGPQEREAIVAHERAHVSNGDLWRRAVLGLCAALGAPALVRSALRLWELSAERLCDGAAARCVGRPSLVASALLALVRPAPAAAAPAGAAFATAAHVAERIESVLREEPGGERAARLLLLGLSVTVAAICVGCVEYAEPLHHALETLLG